MTNKQKSREYDYMLNLSSVKYWHDQLRPNGFKNTKISYSGTRYSYLVKLGRFDRWLQKRVFTIRTSITRNDEIIHENTQKTFNSVEELLYFGEERDENNREIKKIINTYLIDDIHNHLSRSSMSAICAAIKSYFSTNDMEINLKYNGRKRDKFEVEEESELTISEFYKMMTTSKIDLTIHAVMMVKFQAGLDSSTLADRFNYQAYSQISKFCGTTNHRDWDVDKCPIPIKLVRVKTGVQFITFFDRDALSAIKDYLAWREESRDPHNQDGPIFFTSRNTPISVAWIARSFMKLANYSQTQKKIGLRKNKITSHEVRDLLKTTLLVCGVAEHMADHIIGHKPKDSYVKIGKLYPDQLRAEYSKASHMLNIFSDVENKIKNPERPDVMNEKLKKSEAKVAKLLKRIDELEIENNKKIDKSAEIVQKVKDMMEVMIETLENRSDMDLKNRLKEKLYQRL